MVGTVKDGLYKKDEKLGQELIRLLDLWVLMRIEQIW
jgi:hypothetical protein